MSLPTEDECKKCVWHKQVNDEVSYCPNARTVSSCERMRVTVKRIDIKGRRDYILLKKICNCGKVINLADKLCSECCDKLELSKKDSHKQYRSNRTDIWEQRFYMSKEWKQVNKHISVRDKGLCRVCLNDNRTNSRDAVHHIVELKEDRNKALEHSNLICLCDKCHKKVHNAYKTNKLNMQGILRELIRQGVG